MPPPPTRILLIRPSALGDVCRSVPVLASLRAAYPTAKIDWLVQDSFTDAISAHPALTANSGGGGGRAIPFPRKRFAAWYNPAVIADLLKWLKALRASHYDVVIDAQGLFRSAFFAHRTRAPIRIGPADARESGSIFYTHKVPPPPAPHTLDRMLSLLQPLSVETIRDLRLYAPPADVTAVTADPRFAGRYAVLAPTSRWESKRWPQDRYAAVARALLDRGLIQHIVIVGGPGEEAQCPALQALSDPRITNLIGQTRIGRLMAIIQHASVLIGSDSAAVHMACGFAVPTVALYGPTDTAKVGPLGDKVITLQHVEPSETLNHKQPQPGLTQMARITVEEVLAAAQKLA